MTTERYNKILEAKDFNHYVHTCKDNNGNLIVTYTDKLKALELHNYFYGNNKKESSLACHTCVEGIFFQLKVMVEQQLLKELSDYESTINQ